MIRILIAAHDPADRRRAAGPGGGADGGRGSLVDDRKAVIATVEPVHELLARARIGGTIATLAREGRRTRSPRATASPWSPTRSCRCRSRRCSRASRRSRPSAIRRRPISAARRSCARSGVGIAGRSSIRRAPASTSPSESPGAALGPAGDRAAIGRGRRPGARRRPRAQGAGVGGQRRAARRDHRHDRRRQLHPAPAAARAARALHEGGRHHPGRRRAACGSRSQETLRQRPRRPGLSRGSIKAASSPTSRSRVSATISSASAPASMSPPARARRWWCPRTTSIAASA